MTDDQKREIVERIFREMPRVGTGWGGQVDEGQFEVVGTVERILDAADHWTVLEERDALRARVKKLEHAVAASWSYCEEQDDKANEMMAALGAVLGRGERNGVGA